MADENSKMGVEWGYLKTLLNLYNQMVLNYSSYLKYINGMARSNEKKLFFVSISAYYSSVKYNYDKYLERHETLNSSDYINISNKTDEDVLDLYLELCNWSQSEGPFKTMVEVFGPYDAFKF